MCNPNQTKGMEIKALCRTRQGRRGVMNQFFLVMKLTAVLILAACLQVSARGYSQVLSLSYKNAPLEKVLQEIKVQTGFKIFYQDELLQQAHPVTIELNNASLELVLTACFKDQPIGYTITDKTIILTKKAANPLPPPIDIKGTVTTEKGEPVPGATVSVKGTVKITTANAKGEFELRGVDKGAVLVISSVGYEKQEFKVKDQGSISIQLKMAASKLGEVQVTYSSGYQTIPKDRATGSFELIDNELINRSVSTNILDRLNGVTSGLIFNTNVGYLPNQSAITIRGRSTILANPNPLVVVDGFPYDGNITNINPNDVESITVLKDAAAASIWGAYSGNGVIVITTKKGKYGQPTQILFNSNVTVGAKPDLFYTPQISSSDFIDVEEFLYSKGYHRYDQIYQAETPVTDILQKQANGLISAATANSQIDALRSLDVRNQMGRYLYQKAVNQQYSLNVSGGGNNDRYFFSAGYDNDLSNVVGNKNNRLTLNGNNTYAMFNHRIEFATNITFTQQNTQNNAQGPGVSYPYAQLADRNGNALAVSHSMATGYVDTAGQGLLLDWHYRPLDELRYADITSQLTDYRVNFGLKFKIVEGLDLALSYQYEKGLSDLKNYNSQQTFYTRNLINQFSQVNFTSGSVKTPVPYGGILQLYNNESASNNARAQLSYSNSWKNGHAITALAGAELRDINMSSNGYYQYGYNNDLKSSIPADFVNYYPWYQNKYITSQIYSGLSNGGTTNHFLSYFANAAYSFKGRYVLSVSGRRDESNIFGVSTNQKGVPLWSVGASWDVSKESFYHFKPISYLKIRLTDGYNGNVANGVPAVATATAGYGTSYFGAPTLYLNNPPNNQLRWERINIVNLGVDFGLFKNFAEGSVEYYLKNSNDLIGIAPVDPTSGIAQFTGNTANIKGHGLDVKLQTVNINHKFKWVTNFLLSYTKDKVTRFLLQPGNLSDAFHTNNPLVGTPLYSVYSLQWAGLNQQTGDPQVYIDKGVVSDPSKIFTSKNVHNLIYNGPANPTYFGSIRNTFSYKQVSLSCNITYKFNYYFRRPSINYSSLFGGNAIGNQDYEKRWQKQGDESFTNVPSMVYPANGLRDQVYAYSNILIDKADHIRLQDIRLSYDIPKAQLNRMGIQRLQLYVYANNIGIIWKANKDNIDPDVLINQGLVYPNPKTWAVGLNVNF